MCKKVIHFLCIVLLLSLSPIVGHAGPLEDYDEAQTLHLAAVACMAAYSDRYAGFWFDALKQDGWEIIPHVQKSKYADARFLLAKKKFPGQTRAVYLLATTGTETAKDRKVDLRWEKTPFVDQELKSLSPLTIKTSEKSPPLVHTGFYQYVKTALEAGVTEENGHEQSLLTLLKENPDQQVYLVGHSLGGAVSTLGGAWLISAGVNPDQIKVITFGAPAVGNFAFSEYAGHSLNLTRVINYGDPIPNFLLHIPGGYTQFGREIAWETPDDLDSSPHQINVYLDSAIKRYYLARQRALQAGVIAIPNPDVATVPDSPRVYIASSENDLPADLQNEFGYMQDILGDEYRDNIPAANFAAGSLPIADLLQRARELNCQWAIVPEIYGYRVKDKENEYYITLVQKIYQTSDGKLIHAASFGSNTSNLTPLEVFFHNTQNMRDDYLQWLHAKDS
jgi:hypothetical protein